VYVNNHTSVYGSWFRDGRWGYDCCHQFHKNSYCTGATGIEADQAAIRLAGGEIVDMPPPSSPKKGSTDSEQTGDMVKDHLKRKRTDQLDGQTVTTAASTLISEEEYEEYRRSKMARSEDPLLAMQTLKDAV
jgi:pre-mRNA-processing factor SLU7